VEWFKFGHFHQNGIRLGCEKLIDIQLGGKVYLPGIDELEQASGKKRGGSQIAGPKE